MVSKLKLIQFYHEQKTFRSMFYSMAYNAKVLNNSSFHASVGIDSTFATLHCINANHNSAFLCNSRWNVPADIRHQSRSGKPIVCKTELKMLGKWIHPLCWTKFNN